jgi:hypothetical protein
VGGGVLVSGRTLQMEQSDHLQFQASHAQSLRWRYWDAAAQAQIAINDFYNAL